MKIDYSDPAVIAIQNTTPNAGCTIDGQFYDVRNLLATIARLTAERDQARAATAAAYEMAAQVADEIAKDYDVMEPGKPDVYASAKTQRAAKGMVRMVRDDIRALDPDATTALAEMLDAETRACIATVRKRIDDYVRECGSYDPSTGVTEFPGNGEEWISDMEEIEDDLTARIDQRKEMGE